MYLGRDEDYRKARRALLAKFGDTATPSVAERTARACLLLPASEDEMRRILALGERAWGVERAKFPGAYPHFLFLKGLAEYRRGRMAEAISLMNGDASRVLGPAPAWYSPWHCTGAGGSWKPGRRSRRRSRPTTGRRKGPRDQDQWIYHSLRREASATILPETPPLFRQGHWSREHDERLALVRRDCRSKGLHRAAARLFADGFAGDPKLADESAADCLDRAKRAVALRPGRDDERGSSISSQPAVHELVLKQA